MYVLLLLQLIRNINTYTILVLKSFIFRSCFNFDFLKKKKNFSQSKRLFSRISLKVLIYQSFRATKLFICLKFIFFITHYKGELLAVTLDSNFQLFTLVCLNNKFTHCCLKFCPTLANIFKT